MAVDSTAVDVGQLDGMFKDQFHKQVEELIPDNAILQRDNLIEFVPADKMNGEHYSVPTLIRSNQGVSYLGESGDVQDLQDAVPGLMKEALVKGSELNVRARLSYKAAFQASSSERAFKKATGWIVDDLTNVVHTRLEIAALYGQHSEGLGEVQTFTNVSGSTYDIVITEGSFAPGIWIPLEGAVLEAYDTSGTAMLGDRTFAITKVTTSSRTIRVTQGGTTGTLAAGDFLHFKGARTGTSTWNEMCGLVKQFSDSTSTSLFNLDRTSSGLLQGNVHDAAGPISKGVLVNAAMKAVDKGEMGELVALVSSKAWAVLAEEDMALRVFDESYSKDKARSGSKELIYSKVGGDIKVVCHPMIKAEHVLLFNPENCIWVGSSKPTFNLPDGEGRFFLHLPDKNGYEIRNYCDLAVYALKPCRGVLVEGVTFS